RLSIFEGGMSFAAIVAVTAHEPLTENEVLHSVARLVDKSLLALQTSAAGVYYRLLDTTRAYAHERLREAGELRDASQRHARHLQAEILRSQQIEGTADVVRAWFAPACPNTTNLRAALGWSLASPPDSDLALELVGAALPLLMQLSLHAECESRAEQALRVLRSKADSDSELEMRLHAFRGAAMLPTRGPVEQARSALERALELAEQRSDPHFQGLTLSGLFWLWLYRGESQRAIQSAQRIGAAAEARGDHIAVQISANYIAMTTAQLGDQALAYARLTEALERASTHVGLGRFMRVGSDPTVFMRVFLVKALWLTGKSDEARAVYAGCEAALQKPEHALYYCWALNEVMIPFYCFHEEWPAARSASAALERAARAQSMSIRALAARCAALAIDLLKGAGDLAAFEAEVATLRASRFCTLMPWLDGVAVTARMRIGETAAALARVEQAIAESSAATNDWWSAELMRMRAELLADPARALDCARSAQALARRQGALALELRATVMCARIGQDNG
ncbi:MAG TPA: hypothetical protein VMF89_26845, partial [Polyangiales bacterium]|nr:hypothetical protein [Polyangiales bacterium]